MKRIRLQLSNPAFVKGLIALAGCVLVAAAVNFGCWIMLDGAAREVGGEHPVIGEALRKLNHVAARFCGLSLVTWAVLSASIMGSTSAKWKCDDPKLWRWLAFVPILSFVVHSVVTTTWHNRVVTYAPVWVDQGFSKFENGSPLCTDYVNLIMALVSTQVFVTPAVAVLAAGICWFGCRKGFDAQMRSTPLDLN